ncbi:MAG TPA: bifunctional riboflavin kinase/FAD synthetase [Candidatus Limnocylindrales bacterium]|nr:bifunctional riboflavin kinase/FAD synthetase [Candidatus Limnocylindrales bacterium]
MPNGDRVATWQPQTSILAAVARSAEEWKSLVGHSGDRAVVTIGNFDGVHLGHQKILRSVVEYASHRQSEVHPTALLPSVLSFYPHPARVLRPELAPPLLMTLDQRIAAFDAAGIRAVLVLPFDRALSQVSAEDFAQRYLVETLRARAVLVGTNFRFGHRHAGDISLLRRLGERWDFEVRIVPPFSLDGQLVSSSAIRQAVSEGRVDFAARLLGRPYALAGEIRPGSGQGRKLVVPTLNLATEQELLPKFGVYATEVTLDGKLYRAATNVGMRPTFDGTHTTVESHLLDFSEDRTSGPIEVRFCVRVRDEQKFPGPQALREQILKDIKQVREYFQTAGSSVKQNS